ncbi:response regulator [Patescibacteria group bacterium]|nr:response regulator [Patescibacteria group bacterium]
MAKKILLIEDDLATIEIYERAFKQAGFEIESLITGFQARGRLREIREGKKEKPDLILLDLLLPDITNGTPLLKEIKEQTQTKDILVFVLTNYPDLQLGRKLLREGADKFLIKTNYPPSG